MFLCVCVFLFFNLHILAKDFQDKWHLHCNMIRFMTWKIITPTKRFHRFNETHFLVILKWTYHFIHSFTECSWDKPSCYHTDSLLWLLRHSKAPAEHEVVGSSPQNQALEVCKLFLNVNLVLALRSLILYPQSKRSTADNKPFSDASPEMPPEATCSWAF